MRLLILLGVALFLISFCAFAIRRERRKYKSSRDQSFGLFVFYIIWPVIGVFAGIFFLFLALLDVLQ